MSQLDFAIDDLFARREAAGAVIAGAKKRIAILQPVRRNRRHEIERQFHAAVGQKIFVTALAHLFGFPHEWLGDCFIAGMNVIRLDDESVELGALSPQIDDLLQRGVAAYRSDRALADRLFREALAQEPQELAAYYCLYKIHTYMGGLDFAAQIAWDGLREAARQAGWPSDPREWPPQAKADGGPARFALFTLKALSFIELKRGRREAALEHLRTLSIVDPSGAVGWTVIEDLARGVVR